MIKGRSKSFSDKMKGVFRPRPRCYDAYSKPALVSDGEIAAGERFSSGSTPRNALNDTGVICRDDYTNIFARDHLPKSYTLPKNSYFGKGRLSFRKKRYEGPPIQVNTSSDHPHCQSERNRTLGKESLNNVYLNLINASTSVARTQNSPDTFLGEDKFSNRRSPKNSSLKYSTSQHLPTGAHRPYLNVNCSPSNNNNNNNNNNIISTKNNNSYNTSFPNASNNINNNINNNSSRFPSVISFAFGKEKISRNDFIILGLGVHHYIKEVFNSLDYDNNGHVDYRDVQTLCRILGKETLSPKNATCKTEGTKAGCGDNGCEVHFHFRKFSEIICDTFSDFSESSSLQKRNNTQLVNAVVNVTRRNESLNLIAKQLNDLENDYLEFKNRCPSTKDPVTAENVGNCKTCATNKPSKDLIDKNNICLENMKLQKIILLQQQELQCLREVIEDLRVSLQCSDAENLSLRVREANNSNTTSCSEKRHSNASSSPTSDETDSVDRMVSNFPSSEGVDFDSSDSFYSLDSRSSCSQTEKSSSGHKSIPALSRGSAPSRVEDPPPRTKSRHSVNDSCDRTISNFITFKRTDEEGLESQIQESYHRHLCETEWELEDARTGLEIRKRDATINRLNQSLSQMKDANEKQSKENSNMKEKIIFQQRKEEERKAEIDKLNEELEATKKELKSKVKECKELANELDAIHCRRKKELHALKEARDQTSRSLTHVRRYEEGLRAREPDPKHPVTPSHSLTPNINNSHRALADCDNNNNNSNNNDNNNNSSKGSGSIIANNKERCSNPPLMSRRPENDDVRVELDVGDSNAESRLSPTHDARRIFVLSQHHPQSRCQIENRTSSSSLRDSIRSDQFGAHRESLLRRNGILGESENSGGSGSWRERSSFRSICLNEDKPVLEVKPNLIKPISVLKPATKTLGPPSQPSENNAFQHFKPFQKSIETHSEILRDKADAFPIPTCIWRTAAPKSAKMSSSSSQILEELEAEVSFLMKSLGSDHL